MSNDDDTEQHIFASPTLAALPPVTPPLKRDDPHHYLIPRVHEDEITLSPTQLRCLCLDKEGVIDVPRRIGNMPIKCALEHPSLQRDVLKSLDLSPRSLVSLRISPNKDIDGGELRLRHLMGDMRFKLVAVLPTLFALLTARKKTASPIFNYSPPLPQSANFSLRRAHQIIMR